MAGANVGNDRHCWTSNRGEPGNLAGMIHAQLKHKYLRVFRSGKYCERQTNEVIVVASSSMHTAGSTNAATKHFFGGSFTN